MKKRLLLQLIFCFICLNASSQVNWETLNPKPSYKIGRDIKFVSNTTGYILNETELLETTDLGVHWHVKQNISSGNHIDFKNGIGFIVGNNGNVLKSNNNGVTWGYVIIGLNEDLNTVTILNEDIIIISGSTKIAKTEDGGITWQLLPSNLPYDNQITKSAFTSALIGHLACKNGKIYKTVNGGQTWYNTESVNYIPSDFYTIYFVNDNLGFASREFSDVFRTTDGGESWTMIDDLNLPMAVYDFYFVTETLGYASAEYGQIYKTDDSGLTWSSVSSQNAAIIATTFRGVYFTNSITGFAVGDRGMISKTDDGGFSWTPYSNYSSFTHITFASPETAYTVSGNTFFKTTDDGENWLPVGALQNLYNTVNGVQFINEDVGYATCGPAVYKTINGAQTWTLKQVIQSNESITSLAFLDANTGFVSGGYNSTGLYKTTNGGNTWQQINTYRFGQMQFINNQIGYARNTGSSLNIIYKTTDGGSTWTNVFEIDDSVNYIYFIDENVGYAVGEAAVSYKTIDGGATWQQFSLPYETFKKIKFYNTQTGYALTDYSILYKTDDGGETWTYNGSFPGISDFAFNNGDIYAAGTYGKILRSGTGVLSTDTHIDNANSSLKLYPNPATNQISIMNRGKLKIVGIAIFDMTGRNLQQVENPDALEVINIGIGNNTSGVYFAKVYFNNGASETVKFMIR